MGKELNLDMSRPSKRHNVSKPDRQPGSGGEGVLRGFAQQHYQLPERSRKIFMLDVFLHKNRRDPAVKVWKPPQNLLITHFHTLLAGLPPASARSSAWAHTTS